MVGVPTTAPKLQMEALSVVVGLGTAWTAMARPAVVSHLGKKPHYYEIWSIMLEKTQLLLMLGVVIV